MSNAPEGWELVRAIADDTDNSLGEIEALLSRGVDPDTLNWENASVLLEAVELENFSLAELLLKYGADPNKRCGIEGKDTPVTVCDCPEMAKLLLTFGGDARDFTDDPLGGNLFPFQTGTWKLPVLSISEENFLRDATPRMGKFNPELFLPDFWREQIRTNLSGYSAESDHLGSERTSECSPVWSFQRFGRSTTWLPDGRLIVIAGEHEDYYDDDFFIYNDVTVISPAGHVDHYIYPLDVFPPTDFHSATHIDDRIILIGSLGYAQSRNPDETQVLELNLDDFSIRKLEAKGNKPGWIYGHTAELAGTSIRVFGGKRLSIDGKKLISMGEDEVFTLELETLVWS